MNRMPTARAVAVLLLLLLGSLAQSSPLRSENHCEQSISLIFSPAYVLCLPLDFYQDSAVAAVDGFIIKFKDGESFYGHILVAESEELPPDFDMRRFAEYRYGLRSTDELPAPVRERFDAYRRGDQPKAGDVAQKTLATTNVYLRRDGNHVEAFIVRDANSEQILLMGFDGLDDSTIQLILGGLR